MGRPAPGGGPEGDHAPHAPCSQSLHRCCICIYLLCLPCLVIGSGLLSPGFLSINSRLLLAIKQLSLFPFLFLSVEESQVTRFTCLRLPLFTHTRPVVLSTYRLSSHSLVSLPLLLFSQVETHPSSTQHEVRFHSCPRGNRISHCKSRKPRRSRLGALDMLTLTHRAGTTLVASTAPTTQTTSATPNRRAAGTGVTCRSAPSRPTVASASADSNARRATESVSPAAVSPHAPQRP